MKNSLRVLVIERNPDKLLRINAVLEGARYEVLSAGSFSEATEALQVQRFDAVLIGTSASSKEQADFTAGLRKIERDLGVLTKTPVLLCSNSLTSDICRPTCEEGIDAYLPEEFVAATFTDAVVRLAEAVSPNNKVNVQNCSDDLPVFDADKFQEQVAYDKDLLVEIIDLFLDERVTQLNEMRTALAVSDFTRLGRVAHTIKGSLGSLYAGQARMHAQELESAAKRAEAQICHLCLAALEQDLNALEPQLIALRNSVSQ